MYFVKDTLEARNVLIAAHCYAQNELAKINTIKLDEISKEHLDKSKIIQI